MSRKTINVYIILLGLILGCTLMYGIVQFFPEAREKITETKNVNIKDNGISESVKKIESATVYIASATSSGNASGTGFVYKKEGNKLFIITNNHVVKDNKSITVIASNEREVKATLVGGDLYSDIAVLEIPYSSDFKVASLGKSEKVDIGDTVFTIGAPMGLEYKGTVTRGILSGKNRLIPVSTTNTNQSDWIMNVMQTDASMNPGNSGGPLCNVNGEVIGVNSLKIVKQEVEGIGFAIPIEDAISYAKKLESKTETIRPYLGVGMYDVNQSYLMAYNDISIGDKVKSGAVIGSVEPNSPADKAGLQKGDVIVKLNNKDVISVAKFRYYLYDYEPDNKIKLTIMRGNNKKIVTAKLDKQK